MSAADSLSYLNSALQSCIRREQAIVDYIADLHKSCEHRIPEFTPQEAKRMTKDTNRLSKEDKAGILLCGLQVELEFVQKNIESFKRDRMDYLN